MVFLPIVERELRVRARQRGVYWGRLAVVTVGVLVCLSALIGVGRFSTTMAIGREVFGSLAGAAFVLCIGACLLTVEAVSAEREQGTLGLLFVTRVKALDVVLGKLGAVGLMGVWALVGLLPVLMLPLLAGGVTGGEAVRKGLALLNTLVFSLATGLFASGSPKGRLRASRNALTLVLVAVLLPFWLAWAFAGRGAGCLVGSFSPLTSMVYAGDVAYRAHEPAFWISLAVVQGLAWLLLAGAGLRLRRAVQAEGGLPVVRSAKAVREANLALGLGRWRPSQGEDSPIEWLVFRGRGVGVLIWCAAVLPLSASGWMSSAFGGLAAGRGGLRLGFWIYGWVFGIAVGLIGSTVVAWIASRFFVRVRRTGELELLLTTPLGPSSLVSDQWNVLQRFFVWPVPLLQAALLLPLCASVGFLAGGSLAFKALPLALGLLNSGLAAGALCCLGIWFGLKAKDQISAILWTVGLVKGVPLCLGVLASLASQFLLWCLAQAGFPLVRILVHWVLSLLPQLAVCLFYLWSMRWAKGRLQVALTGGESTAAGAGEEITRVLRHWAEKLRAVRHWTP